jgi:hypothetical protein
MLYPQLAVHVPHVLCAVALRDARRQLHDFDAGNERDGTEHEQARERRCHPPHLTQRQSHHLASNHACRICEDAPDLLPHSQS